MADKKTKEHKPFKYNKKKTIIANLVGLIILGLFTFMQSNVVFSTRQVLKNPDLAYDLSSSIKDNIDGFNNCNYKTSFSYDIVAKKCQQKFANYSNLNPVAKTRFASAYAVYEINHELTTDIKHNRVINHNANNSYDNLLEKYLQKHQTELDNINDTSLNKFNKANFTLTNITDKPQNITGLALDDFNGNINNDKGIVSRYHVKSCVDSQLIWQNNKYRWQNINNISQKRKLKSVLVNNLHQYNSHLTANQQKQIIINLVRKYPNLLILQNKYNAKNLIYGEGKSKNKSLQFKPIIESAISHSIPSTQLPYPFTNFHNYNLKVRAYTDKSYDTIQDDPNKGRPYFSQYAISNILNDPWTLSLLKYNCKLPLINKITATKLFPKNIRKYYPEVNKDFNINNNENRFYNIHFKELTEKPAPINPIKGNKEKDTTIVGLNRAVKPYGIIKQNSFSCMSPTDNIPNIAHNAYINLKKKHEWKQHIYNLQNYSIPYLAIKTKTLVNSFNSKQFRKNC